MGDKIVESKTSSPQKSPTKKEIDIATEALNHFAQGKRHLLVNDVSSAVNSLQEACKLLAEHHGETAPECGDAYYYYGRALLEMARVENGVLGNALDGVPEGDDADCSQVEDPEKLTVEEKEKIGKDVGDALEENFVELSSKVSVNGVKESTADSKESKSLVANVDANEIEMTEVSEPVQNGTKLSDDAKLETVQSLPKEDFQPEEISKTEETSPKETSNIEDSKSKDSELKLDSEVKESSESSKSAKDEESKVENKETEKSEDDDNSTEDDEVEGEEVEEGAEEPEAESEEPEGDRTSDDEDVGNLQLAWEVLELSKVIYQRQLEASNKKMSLKIADVHLRLGEVALESENYPQSVEELNQCLEIQLKELESTDRCLAETYYQIGVAHSFSDDFDKALSNFSSAKKVIDDRIQMLTDRKNNPKKDDKPNDCPFYTEEGEIEELKKLVAEISEKVIDMEEMKKDSDKKMQKAKAIAGAAFASLLGGSSPSSSNPFGAPSAFSNGASSSSSPFGESSSASGSATSNISHLIRKKRKPEEEAEKEDPKKVKGENGKPIAAATSSSTVICATTTTTSDSNTTTTTTTDAAPSNGADAAPSNGADAAAPSNGVNGNGTATPVDNDEEMKELPTAEELKKKIASEVVKETESPKEMESA